MRISTQTKMNAIKTSFPEAIKNIKKAGFDCFDISLYDMSDPECPINKDHIGFAKDLRKIADEFGISCNQAHAPFPTSNGTKEYDDFMFDTIIRAMEVAAILGAPSIVVHPKIHLVCWEGNNHQILLRENIDFYKSLIPYCEKFGINVLIENIWQLNGRPVHCVGSSAKELKAMLDEIDHDRIGACLDIGHVYLVGEDINEFISAIAPKLYALHVHDNDFNNDMHILPFATGGKIPWKAVMEALKARGYKGDLTFESDHFLAAVPPALLPSALEYMRKTGEYLKNIFDKA